MLTKFLNWRTFCDCDVNAWESWGAWYYKKNLDEKNGTGEKYKTLHICPQVPFPRAFLYMSSSLKWNVNLHSTTVDPPPPSLKLSSKLHVPESKVGWTAYYMSAAWRSDGAEWMNKWTPLLDLALAFHIALFAYLPLLHSVFLLLWSTIGAIVSISVICCFWGGPPLQWHGGHPLKYVHPSSRESCTGPQLS